MLVFSRQRDESTKIGDQIAVTVTDIRGDRVRLGYVCPPHLRVYRRVLYDGILRDIRNGKGPPAERVKNKEDGMLVLASQRDEETMIIDPVDWFKPLAVVIVVDIRGAKVRLGFQADKSLAIHRQEIYDQIRRIGQGSRAGTTRTILIEFDNQFDF